MPRIFASMTADFKSNLVFDEVARSLVAVWLLLRLVNLS